MNRYPEIFWINTGQWDHRHRKLTWSILYCKDKTTQTRFTTFSIILGVNPSGISYVPMYELVWSCPMNLPLLSHWQIPWWLSLYESKVHGANMGPIWGPQDPGGPHVGPMNFLSGQVGWLSPSWVETFFCLINFNAVSGTFIRESMKMNAVAKNIYTTRSSIPKHGIANI